MFGIIIKEIYPNGLVRKTLIKNVFDTENEARDAISSFISSPNDKYNYEFYKLVKFQEVKNEI